MKTEKEVIYASSVEPSRIIEFTISDFDFSKLIVTKFEKNFLGLKNSILIGLDNSFSNNFVIRKEDKNYYQMFQILFNQLSGNASVKELKDDKKIYTITENENGIEVKKKFCAEKSKLDVIELIEGSGAYKAFNSLIDFLFSQHELEKNEKVKKMVYKKSI